MLACATKTGSLDLPLASSLLRADREKFQCHRTEVDVVIAENH